jgi:SAM-dependent methyltransferase
VKRRTTLPKSSTAPRTVLSQKEHWDREHQKGAIHLHDESQAPTAFAHLAVKYFPWGKRLKILELGCGAGNDSAFFASLGHTIHSLDISKTIIRRNRKIYPSPNLIFRTGDILKFHSIFSDRYDVIYAKGSFHYFTDGQLSTIFENCRNKLKKGGVLIFMGKSEKDPFCGKGQAITGEKNYFEIDGRFRKFFVKRDVVASLEEIALTVIRARYRSGQLYGWQSNWLEVVARK